MGDEDGVNVFPGPGVRKIQFWSDTQGKEFAVYLSNDPDFRAVSNPAANYTKLVEESDYFSDLDYDWKFLLDHWIGMKNGSIKPLLEYDGGGKKPNSTLFGLEDVFTSIEKPNGGRRTKMEKPKPRLKCSYCRLSYNSEKERLEHEIAWHSEKMRKDSNQAKNKPN